MKKAEKYIFATICCTGLLPYILKSVVMLCKKTALLQWQDVLCDLATMALAIVFLGLTLGAYCQEGEYFPSRKRIRRLLYQGAFLFCVIYIAKAGGAVLLSMGMAAVATRTWIIVIATILLALLLLWLLVMRIMKTTATLFAEDTEWIVLLKSWKVCFATLAIIAVLAWGKDGIDMLIANLPIVVRGSFLTQVGYKIGGALLISAVLHGYLCLCRSLLVNDETPAGEAREEKEPITKKEIIVGVMLLLCIVIRSVSVVRAEKEDEGLYKMAAALEEGKKAADLGKNEVAMQHYLKAEKYMQVLEAWLNEDANTLSDLVWENRFDDLYLQLYYVTTKDYWYIENEVRVGGGKEEWYHLLLKEYAALDELSEKQKALQRECLDVCISKEYFCESLAWYRPEDWKRNKVKEEIDAYKDKIFYNHILENLIATQKHGGLSKEAVEEMFVLAEEHQENLYCQTIAMQYGVRYLDTDSSYKERLRDIALRYHALYKHSTEDAKSLGDTKLYVAQVLMQCEAYDKALKLLEEAKETNPELQTAGVAFGCYYAQENLEQVQRLAQECLTENPKDSMALYYSAIAFLPQGAIMESLQTIKILVELVLSEEQRETYMSGLYSYAQKLAFAEEGIVYMDALDITQAPLLYWNVVALDTIYRQGNLELGLNCLEEIDKLCPSLSTTTYLRGVVAYKQEDYDTARQAYETYLKTDEENLTVLYTLASIYEKQGEYDKAWRTCNRIMFLLSSDVAIVGDDELLSKTEELKALVEKEAQE